MPDPKTQGSEKPDPNCGFCYGAWNGLDRWYMRPCECEHPCVEPKCKARKEDQPTD